MRENEVLPPRLFRQIEAYRLRRDLNRGQANPAHRDAAALTQFFHQLLARYRETTGAVALRDSDHVVRLLQ